MTAFPETYRWFLDFIPSLLAATACGRPVKLGRAAAVAGLALGLAAASPAATQEIAYARPGFATPELYDLRR